MLNLLFPSDYFKKNTVDQELQAEYNAAVETGLYNIIVFDYDAWFNSNKLIITKGTALKDVSTIYRGWMMKPEQYAAFYDSLQAKSINLITTPEAYAKFHVFPNIYQLVKEDTAKMLTFPLHEKIDLTDIFKVMDRFMVKDYVKSVKGTDFPKCFDNHISQEKFNDYMNLFYKYRGDLLTGGICVKEFLELKKYGEQTNEYRVFYVNNEIATIYRNSGQHRYTPEPPKALIEKYKVLPSPFYTVDYAELENGTWKIVECGDGGVSGLSDNQDAEEFYRTVYYLIISKEIRPMVLWEALKKAEICESRLAFEANYTNGSVENRKRIFDNCIYWLERDCANDIDKQIKVIATVYKSLHKKIHDNESRPQDILIKIMMLDAALYIFVKCIEKKQ